MWTTLTYGQRLLANQLHDTLLQFGDDWCAFLLQSLQVTWCRCKTLIGSNEGSCTHDRWREGRQWYGEDRRATGRRRLGLREKTVTKCGSAGQSARQSAETDQRTEGQEHGAGIGSDGISGGLLKAERHQTARWRHQLMTSRDADLVAVGMQMVLGIGRQTRT